MQVSNYEHENNNYINVWSVDREHHLVSGEKTFKYLRKSHVYLKNCVPLKAQVSFNLL